MINKLWFWDGTINKAYLGFSIQRNKNCSTPSTVIFFSKVLNHKWHPRVITTWRIIRTGSILPWLKGWNRGTRSTLCHLLLQSSKYRCNCNQDSIKNRDNWEQDTQTQPQINEKTIKNCFQKPNYLITKNQLRNLLIKLRSKNQFKILAIDETITQSSN